MPDERSLKLAVVEGEPRGHYLILHFRNILREALQRGWQVHLVTTERATQAEVFKLIQAEFEGKFTFSFMEDVENSDTAGGLTKIKEHFRRWKAYKAGYVTMTRGFQPDVVYQIALERSDLPMAVLGSPYGKSPFAGLLLIRYFHTKLMGLKTDPLRRSDMAMEWAFKRMLRIPTFRRLITIDPTQAEYPAKVGMRGADKVVYVPDTGPYQGLPPTNLGREHFGIPADAFVLTNYGALSTRKGVGEMINILSHPTCPQNVVGFLAGRHDAEAKALVASEAAKKLIAEGRLFVADRFITEEEESAVFAVSDLVWLGYLQFYGMSSIIIYAGLSGVPVLSMDQGLIEYLTSKHESGITVDVRETENAVAKIIQLMNDPAERKRLGDNGRKFAENHHSQLFGKRVCDVIQDCLPK